MNEENVNVFELRFNYSEMIMFLFEDILRDKINDICWEFSTDRNHLTLTLKKQDKSITYLINIIRVSSNNCKYDVNIGRWDGYKDGRSITLLNTQEHIKYANDPVTYSDYLNVIFADAIDFIINNFNNI